MGRELEEINEAVAGNIIGILYEYFFYIYFFNLYGNMEVLKLNSLFLRVAIEVTLTVTPFCWAKMAFDYNIFDVSF